MYSFPFITKRFWFSHENMSIYTPEDSLGLVRINKSGQVLLKVEERQLEKTTLSSQQVFWLSGTHMDFLQLLSRLSLTVNVALQSIWYSVKLQK